MRNSARRPLAFFLAVTTLFLAGCSIADPSGITLDQGEAKPTKTFPLGIDKVPDESARWGTYCQTVLGQGWVCIVDLRLINQSTVPWGQNDFLTANLVAEDGSISSSSNSIDNETLTGTYMGVINPGDEIQWSVFFSVGENKRFLAIEIIDTIGSTVSRIPICIGSTDELALGCDQ